MRYIYIHTVYIFTDLNISIHMYIYILYIWVYLSLHIYIHSWTFTQYPQIATREREKRVITSVIVPHALRIQPVTVTFPSVITNANWWASGAKTDLRIDGARPYLAWFQETSKPISSHMWQSERSKMIESKPLWFKGLPFPAQGLLHTSWAARRTMCKPRNIAAQHWCYKKSLGLQQNSMHFTCLHWKKWQDCFHPH